MNQHLLNLDPLSPDYPCPVERSRDSGVIQCSICGRPITAGVTCPTCEQISGLPRAAQSELGNIPNSKKKAEIAREALRLISILELMYGCDTRLMDVRADLLKVRRLVWNY